VIRNPMRTGPDVCARAVVAHSPPAKNPRNSRRLIAPPRTRQSIVSVQTRLVKRRRDVRYGSGADICAATSHVRFTPESGYVQCKRSCLLWARSGHAASNYFAVALPRSGICRPGGMAALLSFWKVSWGDAIISAP